MIEDNTEEVTPETTEEQQPNAEDESTEEADELAKAKEVGENQKIRAEKAEAELKKEKAKAEAKVETKTPKNESKETQANEPDYAKLAFLEGKGVKHPDDQKVVQDEANRLKLPLTDVLGMEHIQSKLKTTKTQREAEDGMPDSSGKTSGGKRNSVDYWIDKKDPKNPEAYLSPPDPKLRLEVINARMEKERNKKEFPDQY